ncbi:hypothetical protein [Falsirhodobacter xinxiangensis]|uniref:hypothetical protein n=1 Tax=Falsirhodobacter xinxiangensis TaxID=2530049 RepID=UPI0010AB1A30|nr:hypothetical protein [Rhodobacter xinxiangensis]
MQHTRRGAEEIFAQPVAAPPQQPFTALDLLASAGRHWWLIALLAGGLGYGGFHVASKMPERFRAEAVLVSDARRSGIVELDGEPITGLEDGAATGTIVETISSNIVIRRAMATLPPETMTKLRDLSGLVKREAEGLPPVADEAAHIARFIGRSLEVENSGRSYVVNVRVTSTDPVVSTELSNAIARAYVDYRSQIRRETYERMLSNTSGEAEVLREKLRAAEHRAQTAREQVQLLTLNSRGMTRDAQNRAIEESAALFATQREAERDAAAQAVVYERLLLNQSELQSQMQTPELNVQLFADATVPLAPSGMNPKPVLLALGVLGGGMLALSLGLIRDGLRRRKVRA